MPDVDPETPCEYCTTSPAKLRSGFCSLSSFASHRSTCKNKLSQKKKKQKTKQSAPADAKQPAAAAAKQSTAAAAAAAKRNRSTGTGDPSLPAAKQSKAADAAAAKRSRATGTGDPSLPLELGSTVDVYFGMRPDRALSKSSAVIVDVARVVQFDQSERYAGLEATTSNAATCQYAYQLDYKDEALPLQLPGSGEINPLCEHV